MKKKYAHILIIIISIIFCFGYVLTLINTYYYFKYENLNEIGREDLISRLVFMSNTTGFIFYPLVIIPVFSINYFLMKEKKNYLTMLLSSLIGILTVAGLFYSKVLGNLVYGTKISIVFGVILILISSIVFYFLSKIKN